MSPEVSFQRLRQANPVPDPALLTNESTDLGALLTATKQRSTKMLTQETNKTTSPKPPTRRPLLVAVTAAAAVILIGVLLAIPNLGDSPDVVVDEPATPTTLAPPTPPTTLPAPVVDINAAAPIQVQNDQASRATIEFAGNAQELVEGAVYSVTIEMDIEASAIAPAVSVKLSSVDGELTSTGTSEEGDTFTPTWAWTPDGNKLIATMVGRGVRIPDTRPEVVVTVQETATSDPVEFILTAPAGSGRPG